MLHEGGGLVASVRGYLLSIVAACMIAAISGVFIRNHMAAKVLRLISGVLILLVVVSPLLGLRAESLTDLFDSSGYSEFSPEDAKMQSRLLLAEQIRKSSEKHIETIAAELGLTIQARVTVSDGNLPKPVSVEFIGTGTPEQMKKLSDYVSSGLEIPEENQRWKLYERED